MPAHCGSSSPGRLIVRPPGHRSSSESPGPADGQRGRRVVRPRLAAVGLIQVTDHDQPRTTARAGALAVPVARAPPGPDSVPRPRPGPGDFVTRRRAAAPAWIGLWSDPADLRDSHGRPAVRASDLNLPLSACQGRARAQSGGPRRKKYKYYIFAKHGYTLTFAWHIDKS